MAEENNPGAGGTIVSYNIHGCRGRDGRIDVNRYIRVLQGLNPILAGLQEVDSRQGPDVWDRLADRLCMYPLPGPTLFRGQGRYGNLLLSRFPFRNIDHYDLAVAGREPRRAIDAVVETGAGSLRVILTHLGLSGRERRRQLSRLSGHVAHKWDQGPVIVMGDFNEWLAPGRIAARIHPALTCPLPARTFPARVPMLALDQLFCHPPGLLCNVRALRSAETRLASDHLPLVAELTLSD